MAARDVPPATADSWDSKCALDLVSSVTPKCKIPASRYLQRGRFPVIDQGQGAVAGFVEDADFLHTEPLPVIVFGDHTRVWKFATTPFAVGADGTKLLAPTEEVDPRFCFYALSHAPMRDLGYSRHFKLLREMLIPLPRSKDVQRKIAAILSSVDETIEKTEAVIAQLDVVKKAMLENLLTRGIPGRHSRFKQTEIGEVPEEWVLATLRDVVDEERPITYGIVQPGTHDPEGVLLIRGQDYIGRWREPSTYFRVAKELHEKFKRSRVRAGDVLLCIVGATTGATNIVPSFVNEANITQTTARVTPSLSKALPGFVRCYLESALGQGQVRKFIKGSAQPGLNLGDVEKFLCPLPSIAEQQRIVDAMTSVDARLGAELECLESQKATKAALSEVLLRGDLRVSP
jgi:hypothetical protein